MIINSVYTKKIKKRLEKEEYQNHLQNKLNLNWLDNIKNINKKFSILEKQKLCTINIYLFF